MPFLSVVQEIFGIWHSQGSDNDSMYVVWAWLEFELELSKLDDVSGPKFRGCREKASGAVTKPALNLKGLYICARSISQVRLRTSCR